MIWVHYFDPMMPAAMQSAGLGGLGVTFFFVLSGYLITTILLANDDKQAREQLRTFYIRRTFRIAPLYYFVLAAGLALAIPGFWYSQPWSVLYLTNLMPLLSSKDIGPLAYVGHLWSLAVEEQFYLVWPLAVVFLPRRALWLVAICAVAAVNLYIIAAVAMRMPAIVDGRVFAWTPFASLPALCIGALVSLAQSSLRLREAERVLRWLLPFTVPTLAFLSLNLAMMAATISPAITLFTPLGQILVMAWLIARAALDGPEGSSWGGPVLPWLGAISYGLYVYHLPIRYFVDRLDPEWDSLATRIIGVAATILIAWLSYKFMESPLRQLGRNVATPNSSRFRKYARPSPRTSP